MKTKNFIFAALAGMTLASCSSDDFIAETPPVSTDEGMAPIMFSSQKNNFTRGENDFVGATAAELLGNKFVVSGYKGGQTTWTTSNTGDDAVKNNVIVFDNYLVEYAENTANTTESNSSNWEYVNKGVIKHATDKGITKQTIKYWDYSKDQYDFIAWSTGSKTAIYEGAPAAGEVLVTAITPSTATTAAYTFTGEAADLRECYISDLVTVNKSGTAGYGEVTGYKQPVTLKFRQLGTKVRIGLYETVPGYSVKEVQFYSAPATNDASAAAAKLFTTESNEIYTEGTYKVYFPTVDAPTNVDNNQAHIDFEAAQSGGSPVAQATTIEWGSLNYTIAELGEQTPGKVFLGRSSNAASFAGNAANNYYAVYLPSKTGTNLNLRVNYTLESIDGSGETIIVKGATAQVPLIYTQWKPGYAYTYLFKISDKTNGFTGPYDPTNPDALSTESNPAGLYPITFDAVVVNAEEDATQETITTVSAPSITTYQKGSNVVNQSEYNHSTGAIFVTVNDTHDDTKSPDLAHGKVMTLAASGDGEAALYTLPNDKVYTEADVVSAMQTQDDDAAANTVKGRSGLVLTEAEFELVTSIEYGTDGNAISLTALPNPGGAEGTYSANAMKFTAGSAGTYAFVYTKKASTDETAKYQAKAFADGASVKGYYRYALIAAPTPVADSHEGDVEKGVTYFSNGDASANAITAFLGQGVGNLYTRSGAGTNADPHVYTIASGYAQTGTIYYYTLDGGQSYLAATPIEYANFGSTALYYWDETANDNNGGWVNRTEATPVDGRAYYTTNTGDGSGYCVIYPQRTTSLYVIDKTEANITECGEDDAAVAGMTYFDKYTQNNGEYYAKIIKVQ